MRSQGKGVPFCDVSLCHSFGIPSAMRMNVERASNHGVEGFYMCFTALDANPVRFYMCFTALDANPLQYIAPQARWWAKPQW